MKVAVQAQLHRNDCLCASPPWTSLMHAPRTVHGGRPPRAASTLLRTAWSTTTPRSIGTPSTPARGWVGAWVRGCVGAWVRGWVTESRWQPFARIFFARLTLRQANCAVGCAAETGSYTRADARMATLALVRCRCSPCAHRAVVTEQDLQDTYYPAFVSCANRGNASGLMCSCA